MATTSNRRSVTTVESWANIRLVGSGQCPSIQEISREQQVLLLLLVSLGPHVDNGGAWASQQTQRAGAQISARGNSFGRLLPPVFALTFCKNFVKKFPCPSPSPGVHHVWNLSRGPPAQKNFGAPGPPTGEPERLKRQTGSIIVT